MHSWKWVFTFYSFIIITYWFSESGLPRALKSNYWNEGGMFSWSSSLPISLEKLWRMALILFPEPKHDH
jgi:hypothetical protein